MCSKKTIIEGVTLEGKTFRPTNWAEMVTSFMENGRVVYSPLLQPSVTENGNKCVIIDHTLQTTNPTLYQHILQFAAMNRLRICNVPESKDKE